MTLDEFFDELKKALEQRPDSKLVIDHSYNSKLIRVRTFGMPDQECPITFVCRVKTGECISQVQFSHAAEMIGLCETEACMIADCSDDSRPMRHKDVRERLEAMLSKEEVNAEKQ